MTRTRKANMLDVARSAKVSAMTVARAFSGSAPVASKTRRRILEEARRLNYYPNALVKGVKGHRTKTIGLIFNAATPETTADHIGKIVSQLQSCNYMPYTMALVPRVADLQRILESYLCQRVDGVMIWSDYPAFPYSEEIAGLLEQFHASVFITAEKLIYGCDQIIRSPYSAIREVVDHFVACGRKHPSFFTSLPINQKKVDVFVERLCFHGLSVDKDTHIDPMFDLSVQRSFRDTEFIITFEKKYGTEFPFDSLLIASDEGAAGTMEYLKKCQVKIPEEIAVVGYNNYGLSKFLSPPLASIELNFDEAATAGVEVLINRLNDGDLPQQIREFPLRFIWRESAGEK